MFNSQPAHIAGKQPAWAGARDRLPYGVRKLLQALRGCIHTKP